MYNIKINTIFSEKTLQNISTIRTDTDEGIIEWVPKIDKYIEEEIFISNNSTTYFPEEKHFYSKVNVDVPLSLGDKIIPLITRSIQSISNFEGSVIYDCQFAYCSSLTTIIGNSCTEIGKSAFLECKKLETISFPLCREIGSFAFKECLELKSINLPNCRSINSEAFYGCKKLKEVNMSSCYNLLGSRIFQGCSSLTSISFSTFIISIPVGCFQDCILLTEVPNCGYIGAEAFKNIINLQSINLPSCSSISNNVFENCINLKQVTLDICQYIGESAFKSCFSLSQITLPNCLTIDNNAFESCTSLSTLSLPKCSYLGSNVFLYLDSKANLSLKIKTLYLLLSDSIVSVYNDDARLVFGISNNTIPTGLSIYVPSSLVSFYKASGSPWRSLSGRIFSYNS